MHSSSRSLLLGLGLLCVGCSPYSYSKEVSALNSGVDDLSTGYSSAQTSLVADLAAQRQRAMTERLSYARLTEACATPATKDERKAPCDIVPAISPDRPVARAPLPEDNDALNAQVADAFAALKSYTAALAAITNAKDRADYDAAVSQLASAVKDIGMIAPGVGAVAPAAVNLLGWMVGTALDQQRFDTLKAAVNAVGRPLPPPSNLKPINIVVGRLVDAVATVSLKRRIVLYEEASIMTRQLGPGLGGRDTYKQHLVDTEAVVATLNGLRTNDPEQARKKLADAHQALVDAVNDPMRGYPDLIKAINNFITEASALKKALATTAVSTTSKKGS